MPIETFPIGPLETNCHIVISGSDAVAVDPGGDLNSGLGEVLALLKEQNLTLRAILCTHFHFDHLYGVAALHEATGAPVYGPAGDASLLGTELGGSGAWGFPPVTTFKWEDLKEGPHTFGSIKCEVLTTPGHTPGSLSIYFPELNSIMTGRPALLPLRGPHGLPRQQPGSPAQVAAQEDLHPSAGNRGVSGPRPQHQRRRRTRQQPVPLALTEPPSSPVRGSESIFLISLERFHGSAEKHQESGARLFRRAGHLRYPQVASGELRLRSDHHDRRRGAGRRPERRGRKSPQDRRDQGLYRRPARRVRQGLHLPHAPLRRSV